MKINQIVYKIYMVMLEFKWSAERYVLVYKPVQRIRTSPQ